MLIIAFYKFKARLGLSLSEILHLFQLNLFEKRNIWDIYEDKIPKKTHDRQLLLEFKYL